MSIYPSRATRWLVLALVGLLGAALLAPSAALADTNLVPGGTATVSSANGGEVLLRDGPGFDAAVLLLIPEGTTVDILGDPTWAVDGTAWYPVAVWQTKGYIVATYLALESAPATETAEGQDQAAADPASDPMLGVVQAGEDLAVGADEGGADVAAAQSAAAPGAMLGAAYVSGTNGDGVRCRVATSYDAATIVVLPEGTWLALTGAPLGEWQPVNCADQGGYVNAAFLTLDPEKDADPVDQAPQPDPATDPGTGADTGAGTGWDKGGDAVTGSAVVAGTNGDGVRCRAWDDFGADVLTVLPEGADVALRGDAANGWQPVFCAGGGGFVAAEFLAIGGWTPDPETDPGKDPGSGSDPGGGDTGGDAVTGYAVVAGTNGDGVRCRTGGDFGASVVTVLGEGSEVALRGGALGVWQPVVCAGSNGFVHTDYLSTGGVPDGGTDGGVAPDPGTGTDPGTDPANGGGSNSGLVPGESARVAGTNGDGVRFRSGPGSDAAIIAVLGEGTVVAVTGGSGDWVGVAAYGTTGFVHMEFLVRDDGSGGAPDGGGTTPDPAPEPDPVPGTDNGGNTGGLTFGDHALVDSDLYLRYDAYIGAGIAATAPGGTVVEITGSPANGFYPVSWDGLGGYMYGAYLSWTDLPVTERGGSAPEAPAPPPPADNGGGGSATGSQIANFALGYQGYPYVWATAGPASFDCSGFTYWVIRNVLGIDIGRGLFTQVAAGTPVSQGNLQPGDLVFFQNTYTWGLSHAGIYIGNGQFIHAENESTGVKISDLNSSYYASRWYGAVRMT